MNQFIFAKCQISELHTIGDGFTPEFLETGRIANIYFRKDNGIWSFSHASN